MSICNANYLYSLFPETDFLLSFEFQLKVVIRHNVCGICIIGMRTCIIIP